MTPRSLMREAWVSSVRRPVSAVLVMLLVAATCLLTILTVGRTAAAQAQVQDRLESAGARLLAVVDAQGKGLFTDPVLDVIGSISCVERVFALTTPRDVHATAQGDGGTQVPLWEVSGPMASLVTLTSGRWPEDGEAVVSDAALPALGLSGPYGSVDARDEQWNVVGTFTPLGVVEDIDAGVLAPSGSGQARTMYVVAAAGSDVMTTQTAVLSVVSPEALSDITIQAPDVLAGLQDQVGADLGLFARNLLAIVLSAGAALTAFVVLADVLLRRVDIGRRRALGATRQGVVALIAARTAMPAAAGAVLGCGVGAVAGSWWSQTPPAVFLVGTGLLAFLTAVASSLLPAIIAAAADPVRVLRTP